MTGCVVLYGLALCSEDNSVLRLKNVSPAKGWEGAKQTWGRENGQKKISREARGDMKEIEKQHKRRTDAGWLFCELLMDSDSLILPVRCGVAGGLRLLWGGVSGLGAPDTVESKEYLLPTVFNSVS